MSEDLADVDRLADIGGRMADRADQAREHGAPASAVDTLELLAAELRAGGARFAGVDLVRAYPPEFLLPDPRERSSHGVLRGLEVVRDVLVFVPVAFTWWHLQNALSAYENAPEGTTFLLGWQRGFGGAVWPLGRTALVVALTVMAIIALTAVVHALGATTAADRAYADERRELAGDLVLATMLLAQQDHTQVDRLPMRELSKLGSRVATASANMITALDRTRGDIVKAVDTGPGSALREALNEWIAAARELTQTSRTLEAPQQTLDSLIELHRVVVADGQQLHVGLESLIEGLERGAKAHVSEAHSNRVVATEVGRSVESLGQSLDAFTRRAEQLSELVVQLRHALDRLDQGYDGWGPGRSGVDNVGPLYPQGPR